LLGILFSTLAPSAHALNIFACEPEWAALAQELAGDKASLYSATVGTQDPHRVEARPSLIARARRADLRVCTGAELEVGWLPIVLRESANPAIQPGQPGAFDAATYVTLLDVPTRLDRAEGDVHPGGNPHIQLDPRNYLPVAQALTQRLVQLDPANAPVYQQRHAAFRQNWLAAISRWEKLAAPLKGQPVAVQHKSFPYLENWLGLKAIVALEPRPGMEPGAAHLATVLARLQTQPVRMVLRAAYQSPRPSEWLAERAHIPAVELPFTVGGDGAAQNLYALFDDTLARLLAGLK
jgi:zinc/manganese transport system substrate-binding protein